MNASLTPIATSGNAKAIARRLNQKPANSAAAATGAKLAACSARRMTTQKDTRTTNTTPSITVCLLISLRSLPSIASGYILTFSNVQRTTSAARN